MAESGDGGWWDWLQTAKDKVVTQSSEVLEFVRKDIDEFTKVVSEEASSVVSTTATALKEKLNLEDDESTANQMKKSVSGFLNHVSDVFTPPPDDDDQEAIVIRNQQPVILNRLQAAIYAISQDPATFLTDPEEQEKEYDEWIETFDLKEHQQKLSDLLVDNQPLRDNYTKLVPAEVSHLEFWHRYFFKVNSLEGAEAKRQQLKQRAEKGSTDSEMVWDEDEDFGGDADIPEDVQTQLLEEYEKECGENVQEGTDNKNSKETNKKSCSNSPQKVDNSVEKSSRSSPLSSDSNEDEWEKVDPTDVESEQPSKEKSKKNGKGEDWENWE